MCLVSVAPTTAASARSLPRGCNHSTFPEGSAATSRRQVSQGQPTGGRQTVTVFDWDDTLFCTSFLHINYDLDGPLPENLLLSLQGIEEAVRKLLEMSLACGDVYIITNALSDWVQYSAAKYMPGLLPLLSQITIISARSRFEHVLPGRDDDWKSLTFLEIQQILRSDKIANLISLGDSFRELEAIKVLGRTLGWEEGATTSSSSVFVKTVKFKERPTAEELRKQLELVTNKLPQIVGSAKDLQISLERKAGAPAGKTSTQASGIQAAPEVKTSVRASLGLPLPVPVAVSA